MNDVQQSRRLSVSESINQVQLKRIELVTMTMKMRQIWCYCDNKSKENFLDSSLNLELEGNLFDVGLIMCTSKFNEQCSIDRTTFLTTGHIMNEQVR